MDSLFPSRRATPMMPLLAEVELMALASFALGMLLAYLVALRRSNHRW